MAFNEMVGMYAESAQADNDTQSITPNGDTLLAIERAAAAAPATLTPPPITPSPQQPAATGALPDYLGTLTDLAPLDEINWVDRYKERIDPNPTQDTIDADGFYQELTARQETQARLDAIPDFAIYDAFAHRQYEAGEAGETAKFNDDMELISQRVRHDLGQRGYVSERKINDELADFVHEGKLTADGQKFADRIRNEMRDWIKEHKELAQQEGRQAGEQRVNDRKAYSDFVKTYTPDGIALDEGDRDYITSYVLTGRLEEKLADLSKLSHEEKIQLAMALTPQIRLKLAGAHYEKGAKQGANRHLASRVN